MAVIIFLLIIAIPVVELSILIDVGAEIGAISTVALCLLTAAVGLSLVRMQGVRIFRDMQLKAQAGEPVGDNLIHGFFLLVAGVFLFIPGFITDFFGALLLLPFVRLMLGRAGMAHMVVRSSMHSTSFHSDSFGGTDSKHKADGVTIDGEYTSTEETENKVNEPEIQIIPPQKGTKRD